MEEQQTGAASASSGAAPVETNNQSDTESTSSSSTTSENESWTFLEQGAPEAEVQMQEENVEAPLCQGVLKDPDQDSDGVAVISDDEEVSTTQGGVATPCDPPPIYESSPYVAMPPSDYAFPKKSFDQDACSTTTFRDSEEELPSDFLMTNKKNKLYVHKRNNHLSSLLNFVLVGALIIATTLAVGFTWGINDTCSLDVLDSVNGILSNLQKLQRENELLKSKIRVLRMMKHNKPIEKDVNFDKYLEYQMHLEQEKMIPKFAKSDNLIGKIPDYQLIVDSEPPHVNKRTMNIMETDLHKEETNNTHFFTADVIQDKTIYDNADNSNINYNINKPKVTQNDKEYTEDLGNKQRSKRDTNKPAGDPKSLCENASSSNDKQHRKKCSLLNKQNNQEYKKELKKEKFKGKWEENAKMKDDSEDVKVYKKDYEKFAFNDRQKSREYKKEKKFRMRDDSIKYADNQEHHNHFNDNIKADWYQKMYEGRKEIRDKGFDEYDLLDAKNKAKWYFKRMKERERTRGNLNDKYRRQMHKDYIMKPKI